MPGNNPPTELPEKYAMQEYGKNCVMMALSKVLSVSIFDLAKQIVDEKIGGVTMIKEMENGSVIKKVLQQLGFVSLIEGGAVWSKMKLLVQSHGLIVDNKGKPVEVYSHTTKQGREKTTHFKQAKFYAVYWRGKTKEDWTDKPVQPGASDHAFTIFVSGPTINIPPTNDTDFDKSHRPLLDNDFVSVFKPPA